MTYMEIAQVVHRYPHKQLITIRHLHHQLLIHHHI